MFTTMHKIDQKLHHIIFKFISFVKRLLRLLLGEKKSNESNTFAVDIHKSRQSSSTEHISEVELELMQESGTDSHLHYENDVIIPKQNLRGVQGRQEHTVHDH